MGRHVSRGGVREGRRGHGNNSNIFGQKAWDGNASCGRSNTGQRRSMFAACRQGEQSERYTRRRLASTGRVKRGICKRSQTVVDPLHVNNMRDLFHKAVQLETLTIQEKKVKNKKLPSAPSLSSSLSPNPLCASLNKKTTRHEQRNTETARSHRLETA